jgi:hypothetical protein
VWTWEFELVKDENDGETTCFGVATQPFSEAYNAAGMHVLRCFNGELYSNGNTIPRGRDQRTKVHPGTWWLSALGAGCWKFWRARPRSHVCSHVCCRLCAHVWHVCF